MILTFDRLFDGPNPERPAGYATDNSGNDVGLDNIDYKIFCLHAEAGERLTALRSKPKVEHLTHAGETQPTIGNGEEKTHQKKRREGINTVPEVADALANHITRYTVGASAPDTCARDSCRQHPYSEGPTPYGPVGGTTVAAADIDADEYKEDEVTQYD